MTAPQRQKILVVDDDLRLRDLLKRYLTEQGFAVDTVADAAAMDRQLTRVRYDLLVLDLMLPGEDGLAICRRLRASGRGQPPRGQDSIDVSIIMLTAKGDDVDRIVGLEMGADDYLAKPFNPRELVARIHAVLRRRRPPEMPGAPASEEKLVRFGPYELNLATRALTRAGENVPLTTGEFALLKVLASHPREPMSRDKLMDLARGREHESYDRSIDVQVSRLRKLLGEDPQSPRYIQTVWGFGYVFVPDGGTVATGAAPSGTGSK
jgi:two-component system, OmpR family, phosphate regulon response regulator OmpR